MSNAPDPGWPHPPAGHPPVPPSGAGPGAAPPAASLKWRLLHSWWLLLPILGMSCLGGFGFIYVGFRAKRAAWWIAGIAYTLIGWTAFILVGESDTAIKEWATGAVLAIWMATIVHAVLINSSWLRWRAGFRPWHAASPAAGSAAGGAYPPGTLAPPPGLSPATPAAQSPNHPPTSPAYPPTPSMQSPASPAYPPTSPAYPPAYPPASPAYPSAGPGSDPATAAYPTGAYFGPGPVAAPVPAQGQPAAASAGQLDVNAARLDDLAALPGFDPQRARYVLTERDRRGGFGGLPEFAAAANLAPHEYARLRDRLVCTPPTGPAPGQPPQGRVLDV